MMGRHYSKRFWAVLKLLKEAVPTRRKLSVRIVSTHILERANGGVPVFGDYHNGVIRIEAWQEEAVAIETLVHEYAHHVAMRDGGHGKAWERAYGRCYRAVYGD